MNPNTLAYVTLFAPLAATVVITLLNLSPAGLLRIDRPKLKLVGLAASAGVVGLVVATAIRASAWRGPPAELAPGSYRNAAGEVVQQQALRLSDQLFSRHLLPFEIASVLLLVAIVGAVALTKKKV